MAHAYLHAMAIGLAVVNHRAGSPLSPRMPHETTSVLVRYMYEGSTLSQGRLCRIEKPSSPLSVSSTEVYEALASDGVDLERFAAAAYETDSSSGAWFQLPDPDAAAPEAVVDFPLVEDAARRVDIKLFVKEPSERLDANLALAEATPCGALAPSGYFAIGVVNTKNQANVGTLWRSAYQLGAGFLFTIGTRYRHAPTDTVSAPQRVPLFEYNDWNAFVEGAPRGAQWVAVEMGGTPLSEFEHPRDAVYILGSEDAGVPKSVLRACHRVVSIECENYASYNVAVAGALVMYDRMAKERGRRQAWEAERGGGGGASASSS